MTNEQIEEFMERCSAILSEMDPDENIQMVMGLYDKRGDKKRPPGDAAMAVEVMNMDVRKHFTCVIGSIAEAILRVSHSKGELPVEVPCGGTSDCYYFVGSALRAVAHSMSHMADDAERQEREEDDNHEREANLKTHH